jgi:hypothetical protein
VVVVVGAVVVVVVGAVVVVVVGATVVVVVGAVVVVVGTVVVVVVVVTGVLVLTEDVEPGVLLQAATRGTMIASKMVARIKILFILTSIIHSKRVTVLSQKGRGQIPAPF